jgi:hypothetical protein
MKLKRIGKWLIFPGKWFRSFVELIGERPILAGLLLLVITGFIVRGIAIKRGHNYSTDKTFIDNILIEAHGLVFDIFVFGVLIVFFTQMGERRRNIRRWQEEIDDFRGWDEKEAMYRIVGNIKRLNRKGVSKIRLTECYLKNAELSYSNLKGAILSRANCQGAYLWHSNLQDAILIAVDFQEAFLEAANLRRVEGKGVKLIDADLMGVNLHESDLQGANLQGANLMSANLQGTNLEGANLQEAILLKAKNLTIEQLSRVETLYKTQMDRNLKKQVKETYPHLFEKPQEEK